MKHKEIAGYVFGLKGGEIILVDTNNTMGIKKLLSELGIFNIEQFAPMIQFKEAGVAFSIQTTEDFGDISDLFIEIKVREINLIKGSFLKFLELATKGELKELIVGYSPLPF